MADARTADAMSTKGAMGIAELLMHQFGARVKDDSPAQTGSTAATGTATTAEGA